VAKAGSMITVGLTGRSGGSLKTLVDYCLQVPSDDTPRIQEAHILLGHILCEYVEEALFAKGKQGKGKMPLSSRGNAVVGRRNHE
jgi:D-sedoheptulose 7-phosphate isomerase